MRKILPFFLLCMLFISSCKKDTKKTAASSPAPQSSADYGLLGVQKSDTLKNGILTGPFFSASATFYCAPNGLVNGAPSVPVDSVSLNGNSMWYGGGTYYDTASWSVFHNPPLPINYPYTFKVVDDSCIPSFSYTENGPYPTYTGASNLPDTVHKNGDLVISLAGSSNYDFISVSIDDGSNLGTGHSTGVQPDPPFPSSVTIHASDMSNFTPGNKAILQFSVSKINKKTYSNKTMDFATSYNLIKVVVIK
ncbi:MAG: hypothetical protein ACXVC6_10845 [Bacteroidia bacterium]